MTSSRLSVLEICAGAGGQALGLEMAHFEHQAAVEIEAVACETLRQNRPDWNVVGPPDHQGDVREFDGRPYRGVDLLAGGVPCPPFSVAGKQLGSDDERDLFPAALRLIKEIRPRAVLLENVPGLGTSRFTAYRSGIEQQLKALRYHHVWKPLNASTFGVPQLRPRFVLVAFARSEDIQRFHWPTRSIEPPTVGEALFTLMAANCWPGAFKWRERANTIAPTLVGGSKKHGGADLGPTRAKAAWRLLGVDAMGIADNPPGPDFPVNGLPKLTLEMVARLQGFPDDWTFAGKKTAIYRQIGNAFPPPAARALGEAIRDALLGVSATQRPAVSAPEGAVNCRTRRNA